MAIVFDKDGNGLKCEAVDAKELIASGEYTAAKVEVKAKKLKTVKVKAEKSE